MENLILKTVKENTQNKQLVKWYSMNISKIEKIVPNFVKKIEVFEGDKEKKLIGYKKQVQNNNARLRNLAEERAIFEQKNVTFLNR